MNEYREIAIDKIQANSYQPRETFDEEELDELAQSIRQSGLMQPIVVRQDGENYQLIAGERRLRACRRLEMKTIRAHIIDASEQESAQMALIENIQRSDLSSMELAKGYQAYLQKEDITQAELARRLGKSQPAIANTLRLLNLHPQVQQAIAERQISERHGRALLSLSPENQEKVLKKILEKGYNVEATEKYVASLKDRKKSPAMKCFGVSGFLIRNSIVSYLEQYKKLSKDFAVSEEETDDRIVMTISIKK